MFQYLMKHVRCKLFLLILLEKEMAESIVISEITKIIRNRRSIFPPSYIDKEIPEDLLLEILENANWAPTHKLTEPWRFKVFRGSALQRLSDYLGEWYKDNTPAEKYSDKKYEKTINKPLQSACVIAICMARDEQQRLPEWEELAAVACAVQNMWLTATAYNVGGYWSSPRSITEARDFLKLQENEHCYGLFYMGYHKMPALPGKRKPIAEKVEWINL